MDNSSPKNTQVDPPLVDVKVTNPVTYFKKVWNKIIGNEGVDFRFHIKPLTAIIIAAIIAVIGFGVGGVVIDESPIGSSTPTPTPQDIWKETAYTGTLQFSENNNRYYLLTTSSAEAITLEVPDVVNINALVGKRILAVGDYSKSTKILKVTDIKDLEVLSKTPLPIPTVTPMPDATPTSTPEPSPTPTNTY
jgi:hypothetical protein